MSIATFARTASTSLLRGLWGRDRATGRRRARGIGFRPAIDRLESRIALAVDTLSIGAGQVASFADSTGDLVIVSISGAAGTAVFRDAGGGIVNDGDEIATVAITGASPDFVLTFGASRLVGTGGIGPLRVVDTVALGRITADSVIRGIYTVTSEAAFDSGSPAATVADPIRFSLESFEGVDFSKGGGLFVDVVTGDVENLGILLAKGFSPYSTIAVREQLDAVIVLGAENNAKADGRLLIESATAASRIFVNNSGDTRANSKLEILGGAGPFDAGVGFRSTFSGTVNLQTAAGGSWVFEGGIASGAVLTAASWEGFSEDAPAPFPGVAVYGDFAGTLNTTAPLTADVSATAIVSGIGLAVGGDVKGTARVNSAEGLFLVVEGSVLKGAQFNAVGACVAEVGGNFSGGLSAGAEGLLALIQGNVSGAQFVSSSGVDLVVGAEVTVTAVDVKLPARTITNSSVVAASDISLEVTGDVVKSTFVGRNIFFGGPVPVGDVTASIPISSGVRGSVRNSRFTAGGFLQGTVGGSVASSVLQGQGGMIVDVDGGVAKTRFVATVGEVTVGVGRDFQGAIEGGAADVRLYAVNGSVLKGSSVLTAGDAEVDLAGNFDGTVTSDNLRFFVNGNVSKASRIVAARVGGFTEPSGQNFRVGGRFDGILNVGVFDAAVGAPQVVTIIGGGAGTSARFYVGRFETDGIVVEGDFRGNMRVLQDLTTALVFTGNADRITIGGQVLASIVVQGRLQYLSSNSYFVADLPGKRTGVFVNGAFQATGNLTTGSYVTVVPPSPLPVLIRQRS